jgi:hypothetical protein
MRDVVMRDMMKRDVVMRDVVKRDVTMRVYRQFLLP